MSCTYCGVARAVRESYDGISCKSCLAYLVESLEVEVAEAREAGRAEEREEIEDKLSRMRCTEAREYAYDDGWEALDAAVGAVHERGTAQERTQGDQT